MHLRRLTPADLPDVADVHRAAFPRAALARLGRGAVQRHYATVLEGDPHGVALGAFTDDGAGLAGFCFVGRRFEVEPAFLRRHRFYLACCAALRPWVLRDALFRDRLRAGLRHLLRRSKPADPPPVERARPAPLGEAEQSSFGVQYLVVHPRHQGHGVGRTLLHAAEAHARDAGRRHVELSVFTDNTSAIDFYERQGWRKVVAGPRWDGLMAKNLASVRRVAPEKIGDHPGNLPGPRSGSWCATRN